jgi:dihydrodipicolinate synthase/N-acetylneuraminate lyase
MKRYRPCILATCCAPWNEDLSFAEDVFRNQVRTLISHGIRDLYIFGTAGEGYAVTESQFDHVTRVFLEETKIPDVQSMVGVISLSLPTIIERIERARAMGARRFQISLPSWGALSDAELTTFFRETCGRFPDCEFLHYNLMRTKRLVTPKEYGRLAAEHPNLVATKNSTADLERLRGLLTEAPQLQHFPTETGFAYASLIGECGLLISLASTNLTTGRAYFQAGREGNVTLLMEMQRELSRLTEDLMALVGDSAHIDGAFDKLFCRLHDRRFPLRMLPPYTSVSDELFERFAAALQEKYPRWFDEG